MHLQSQHCTHLACQALSKTLSRNLSRIGLSHPAQWTIFCDSSHHVAILGGRQKSACLVPKVREHCAVLDPSKQKSSERQALDKAYTASQILPTYSLQRRNGQVSARRLTHVDALSLRWIKTNFSWSVSSISWNGYLLFSPFKSIHARGISNAPNAWTKTINAFNSFYKKFKSTISKHITYIPGHLCVFSSCISLCFSRWHAFGCRETLFPAMWRHAGTEPIRLQ